MPGEPIVPHLELRQAQSLIMTPQLQQAIKILQMNNVELNAFVAEELERNPLLEREEDNDISENINTENATTENEPTSEVLDVQTRNGYEMSGISTDTTAELDVDDLLNTPLDDEDEEE